MKTETKDIRLVFQVLLYIGLANLTAAPVFAQVPVDENGNPVAPLVDGATIENFDDAELPTLSVAELEDIVGPVALYPDDLLAIVLPASTYPLQVVQAARFLEQLQTDPSLKPDEEWDESITALLNYPEVVELMNEDIDWTWRLGEAVVAQQADVIAATEAFRDKAYAAGNLKSDERQTVSNEDGVIEIEPVNEDVIYVPYYEPERVVVYQSQPAYNYYPQPYPVYYYPYPIGYSFASDYFWGVTTAFSIGWLSNSLNVYHPSYWGHPYYGRQYYNNYFYRRPSLSFFNQHYVYNSNRYSNYRYRDGDYWRPRRHGGARPGHSRRQSVHYYRDRSRDDSSHRSNDRRRDRNDGNHRNLRDRDRGNYNASRSGNRNDAGNRVRRSNGDRQARNRNRGNPGDRRDRNSSGSPDRNAISFQSRDSRARADQERRRTRASENLNRSSVPRRGFAASPSRSSVSSNNRRSNASRTARPGALPRPSTRSSHGRSKQVAMNEPRRRILPSLPRQVSSPSLQRQPTRSQRQRSSPQYSAPQRSAAPRSAPVRRAAPPSASRRSAAPRSAPARRAAPPRASRRSAAPRSAPARRAAPPRAPQRSAGSGRSSRSSSRSSSSRGESRSRRRH